MKEKVIQLCFTMQPTPITEVQMLARMPVDPPNSKEAAACAGLRQIAAGDVPCATLISTQ